MAGKQKPDLELAIQRELVHRKKVPCPKKEVVTTLCRTPSFKSWTYTGSVKNASALGYLALGHEPSSLKVQSSAQIPKLPSSSPNPQNQMAQSLIKDEPYSSEPPGFESPTPTLKDWIGPSNVSDAPPLVRKKAPPRRSNPRPDPVQATNTARSSSPFPSPICVPTKPRSKRKAPAENEQLQPCPNPTKKKSTDSLVCDICQVGCSSPLTMQQHLMGRPHKAKLEWMKLKRNNAGRRGTPMCDVCQIWCSDRDGLEMHLKGQKHRARLQELENCGGGLWAVDKRPILCDLCGVHSMNGDLFKMHLKGKQHAVRLELTRRGMLN